MLTFVYKLLYDVTLFITPYAENCNIQEINNNKNNISNFLWYYYPDNILVNKNKIIH